MHRTWCTKSYVTKGAQVLSHQDLHTYSTLQYITLHYSKVQYITLHYSTLHYSTVHYSTYMQRTCKSSVTRGAQVLSHQNVHTYLTYIFQSFSIYLIALKYCLYINRRKNGKSYIFVKYIFLKMGTSPKSSFFQRLARGLRPNDGVVQRGPHYGSF